MAVKPKSQTKLVTKTSEEKDHATYSASGAERWLNCPGSISLCEKAPPARESEYALEGTQAHACLEFLLKNLGNLAPALQLAANTYTEEMIDHAYDTVLWVLEKQAELKGSTIGAETRVDSSSFTLAGQFGTLDVQIAQPFGRLVIMDYKYGAGVTRNPEGDDGLGDSQLVYYALAVAHEHDYNFVDIELVVDQPRAYHESGETRRSHVLTMAQLLAWKPKFYDGVRRTLQKSPATNPGSWCKFCNAATICPSLKDSAMKKAQIVFSDTKGIVSVPTPELIKLPNLSIALDACDKLEAWIKKVREHAYHVLETGGDVDGFKLVYKKSPRRWGNPDAAIGEATKLWGDKALAEPKLLSPAQLEKALKDDSKLEQFVAQYMTDESSGTTLVRASDKRDPVRKIDKVFTQLEPAKPKKGK